MPNISKKSTKEFSARSRATPQSAAILPPQEVNAAAPAVQHWTVDADEAGQRIDNYLFTRMKGVPKSHIYRILRGGEVRVNKGRIAADYRVAAGDVLRIPPIRVAAVETKGPAPSRDFPILLEDELLLAIDKPAGVAVHGGSGVSFGVIEQLRSARGQPKFLELVHRLDRETSGILLVAKKRAALVHLHSQLRAGQTDKRYLVVVKGLCAWDTREVEAPLLKFLTPEGERRVRVSSDGQTARTVFRVRQRYVGYTLLEAELDTGRTHQIRVHLQHLGLPIVGDDKYGDFAVNRELVGDGLRRMFLHARKLTFRHPLDNHKVTLDAELPRELQHWLNRLQIAAER